MGNGNGYGYEVQNSNVMKINKMNITGNVVPISWFQHLRFEKSDKPHLPAIMILSDIIYWYRPMKKRDEETGMVVEYKQKFKADMLQKQYKLWMELYGFGKSQTKNAVDYLVDKGIINREFRTVELPGGEILYNRMFVEPIPEAIEKITYPHNKEKEKKIDDNKDGEFENTPSPSQNKEGGISKQGGGNIENKGTSSQNNNPHTSKQTGGSADVNNTDTTTGTSTESTSSSNNNINKKGNSKKLSTDDLSTTQQFSKVYEIFNAAFGKHPNQIQINKLKSYDIDNELIYYIIKQMGLGGHNTTFMFNKLNELKDSGITTINQYTKNNNSTKDEEINKSVDFDWDLNNISNDNQSKNTNIQKQENKNLEEKVDPKTYKPQKLEYIEDSIEKKNKEDGKKIWDEICNYLKKELTTISFNTWFRPIQVDKEIKNNKLKLKAPNFFIKDWIEKNYYGLIADILYSLTNKNDFIIEINSN